MREMRVNSVRVQEFARKSRNMRTSICVNGRKNVNKDTRQREKGLPEVKWVLVV